ncbi:MAG: DNA recombination protein RmuC [Bacteroidetes bacterium]|nr:DNA recombination protein RmuC [Bacteroidota bacterium]
MLYLCVMQMMIVYILIAILLTAVITYIVVQRLFSSNLNNSQQHAVELEKQNESLKASVSQLQSFQQKTEMMLSDERKQTLQLTNDLATAQTRYEDALKRMNEQKQELEQMQQKLKTEFENLANKILDEKSRKFTDQNKVNLDIILNPLKEKIKDFEEKVDKTYKAESDERISLKTQIANLVELNKQLSSEANNLATALKGDNKKQGNWGELVLEKILESSGLIKGQEYKTQVSAINDNGDSIKPDVIVFLPDNKHLIIDSKVSLVAYNEYVSSDDEEARTQYASQHVQSVRNHIRQLSDKNYQTANGYSSPDFVILFMPVESAFSFAMQVDKDLYNFAWERKIVLVSPTTLLATLRTVASIWKHERQVKNAMQIAEEGGKMYDKLVLFVTDLISIGKKMDGAKEDYVEAMKKLTDGTGNLVGRAQKMKELGAKASKSLPGQLIERAGE